MWFGLFFVTGHSFSFCSVLGPGFRLVFLCVLVVRSPFSISLVVLSMFVGFKTPRHQQCRKTNKLKNYELTHLTQKRLLKSP